MWNFQCHKPFYLYVFADKQTLSILLWWNIYALKSNWRWACDTCTTLIILYCQVTKKTSEAGECSATAPFRTMGCSVFVYGFFHLQKAVCEEEYSPFNNLWRDYDPLRTAVSLPQKMSMWEEEYVINYLCEWTEVVKNAEVVKSQIM